MGNGRSSLSKTAGSKKFAKSPFQRMSAEEAGEFYDNVPRISVFEASKLGLNPGQRFQALIHELQLHGKPTVLPDDEFLAQAKDNALHNMIMYRGVGSERSLNSLMYSDTTYIGNGIHGNGLYFSTSLDTAVMYSDGSNNIGRAYIDKDKARVVTESALRRALSHESPAVRERFSGNSGLSAYALYRGYNVIHVPGGNAGTSYSIQTRGRTRGEDFYVPLVRDVLVFSEHYR